MFMINTQMRKMQQGFTLIELMIVVAIIGILAAIALPAYQDYTRKSRFSEVMAVSDGLKTPIAECMANNGGVLTTCDNGAEGIPAAPAATRNIATLVVADGVITGTGTAVAGGWTSILTPTAGNGLTIWTQSGTCLAAGACKQ
jgi:prepilin-type N-terminal cleavage/methylation domain-containing protein